MKRIAMLWAAFLAAVLIAGATWAQFIPMMVNTGDTSQTYPIGIFVPTNRTLTINGQVWRLNSNGAFTVVGDLPAITNWAFSAVYGLTNTTHPIWLCSIPQAATLREFFCEITTGSLTGMVWPVYCSEVDMQTTWYAIDIKRPLTISGNLDTGFPTSALPARQLVGAMISDLNMFAWTNSAKFRVGYTIP